MVSIEQQVEMWNEFINDDNYLVKWRDGEVYHQVTEITYNREGFWYRLDGQPTAWVAESDREEFLANLKLYQLREVDINAGFVVKRGNWL